MDEGSDKKKTDKYSKFTRIVFRVCVALIILSLTIQVGYQKQYIRVLEKNSTLYKMEIEMLKQVEAAQDSNLNLMRESIDLQKQIIDAKDSTVGKCQDMLGDFQKSVKSLESCTSMLHDSTAALRKCAQECGDSTVYQGDGAHVMNGFTADGQLASSH